MGVRMVPAPIEAKTWSKLATNFVFRSRIKTVPSGRLPRGLRRSHERPGYRRTVRLGRGPEQVRDAPFDFDHEQHVVAPQQHGVDGEEVGGDDAPSLGAEELGPRGSVSLRRGPESVAEEDVGDTALGDRDAELLEFADDAQVTPALGCPWPGGRPVRPSRGEGVAALLRDGDRSNAARRGRDASEGPSRA